MKTNIKFEADYWPGYVDALINVVLNLLFLVGIFAVGLVVLNYQVEEWRSKKTKYSLPSVDVLEAEFDGENGVDFQGVRKYSKFKKSIELMKSDKSREVEGVDLNDFVNDVTHGEVAGILHFNKDESLWINGFELDLRKYYLDDEWFLLAFADLDDPFSKRAAFNMLMRARNFLNAQGVAYSKMNIRIEKNKISHRPTLSFESVVVIANLKRNELLEIER